MATTMRHYICIGSITVGEGGVRGRRYVGSTKASLASTQPERP